MNTCAVSFKECWQNESGAWFSDGGFPLQMSGLASLFDEMTIVTVGVPPRSGGLPLPQHARVVPLRRLPGQDIQRKLFLLLNLRYYLSAISFHVRNADVVQVPLPGDIPFLGFLVAIALRKRTLVRYEGSWTRNTRTTFMNSVTRTCLRLVAGRRNVVLATGEGDRPPARRIRWMFATVLTQAELDRIRPVTRAGLLDPPVLVYLGRLSPEKGVKHLIQAIALLNRGGFSPMPVLTLIGDGPERASLEALAVQLHCTESVRFLGQLDRRSMSPELQQADLCVTPSLSEGYCKAWLDAMAHGLPVLTSDVGAARAVIGMQGERGWTVPAGDTDALALAVRGVLANALDWSALRRRCRAFAEARHVENWRNRIAEICAREWELSIVGGKLREPAWEHSPKPASPLHRMAGKG